jgi:hypothetical protein
MAEFERVPLRPRPNRNWLPTIGLGFAIFIALVIVKPWDSPLPSTAGNPTTQPTFFVAPTERTGVPDYNPLLFGLREPDPAWELWPAGYVVQFGLAGPVRVHGQDGATPAPGASASPGPSEEPRASTAATAPPPDPSDAPGSTEPGVDTPPPPTDPHVVDLGPADHLVALGINMPLEFRVISIDLELERGDDCCLEAVPHVRLPTLWESAHFVVIAPEDPAAAGQPDAWTPGEYLLYLAARDGELREIRFVVRPASD